MPSRKETDREDGAAGKGFACLKRRETRWQFIRGNYRNVDFEILSFSETRINGWNRDNEESCTEIIINFILVRDFTCYFYLCICVDNVRRELD